MDEDKVAIRRDYFEMYVRMAVEIASMDDSAVVDHYGNCVFDCGGSFAQNEDGSDGDFVHGARCPRRLADLCSPETAKRRSRVG